MRYKQALGAALLAVLALTATACSGEAGPNATSSVSVNTPAAEHAVEKGAAIIDVRTPEEYAAGHLKGAVNIDVEQADFTQRVAKLPTDKTYVVYCHSGNRATTASELMKKEGFEHVINGGGYEALLMTGLPKA